MSDQKWEAVRQPVGAGVAAKRPWTVQRPGQWYTSDSGRVHRYATQRAAAKVAKRLNEEEADEAELKAKYAKEPPMPSLSLGRTIAKAIGR